jgi:hypothetical protein
MMSSGGSSARELTRRFREASPDKNREWAGSGIDRPRERPVTFAFTTATGSLTIRPRDLLLRSTRGCAVLPVSDPKEEGRW